MSPDWLGQRSLCMPKAGRLGTLKREMSAPRRLCRGTGEAARTMQDLSFPLPSNFVRLAHPAPLSLLTPHQSSMRTRTRTPPPSWSSSPTYLVSVTLPGARAPLGQCHSLRLPTPALNPPRRAAPIGPRLEMP
ncbi:hypothetical protein BDP55DRAFT_721355 [Colletotrichum godetiae]|uniref:Uncharacterized protein n=1 Tax=Colletotrichum godetiae TaxID=1209918 RepID=A0AAJ0A9I2_9PEZI|nr:uncharacterized protein BDP55DRAFT_721355 [Colletotrichum godetiae]KAK1657487.1 hypothetical protein BDP55DRAFT_721355 [Colletotrichum godetiae]